MSAETVVVLIARGVLAAVFAVAGIAKWLDRDGARSAAAGYGVPAVLVPVVVWGVPVAEIGIAVLLLPVATAWWGGIASAVLLAVFLGGIGYNIARGRAPECHCFGQLHSEPVGWPTFGRNAVLAAMGGAVVWAGPVNAEGSFTAWTGSLTVGESVLAGGLVLAVVAIGAMALVVAQMFAQRGRILARLTAVEDALVQQPGRQVQGVPRAAGPSAPVAAAVQGLAVGVPGPAFELPNLAGRQVSVATLLARGKSMLLMFVDTNCAACTQLVPDIAQWRERLADTHTIVLISRGPLKENRRKFLGTRVDDVLIQEGLDVSTGYRMLGTPSAVVVTASGRIGSAAAFGAEAIRGLVAGQIAAVASRDPGSRTAQGADQPAIGRIAPVVRLPDLAGRVRSLVEFGGRDTLVLFWNPGCGYCSSMLSDLKRWEAESVVGGPQLVVVSTGEREANRALGLRALVLLDAGFAVAHAFGARGTPSAVLVGADGRIASDVAVGAAAIFALAGPVAVGDAASIEEGVLV